MLYKIIDSDGNDRGLIEATGYADARLNAQAMLGAGTMVTFVDKTVQELAEDELKAQERVETARMQDDAYLLSKAGPF